MIGVAAADVVTVFVAAGHGVEKLLDSFKHGTGHFDAGHSGALQCHDEPAGDRHVAVLAGHIAPAAFGCLNFHAVVDGALCSVEIRFVAGHCV
jgi:hypothetical protein